MRALRWVSFGLVVAWAGLPVMAQDAVIQRASSPPVIDGLGDDAVWATATAHGQDEFFELVGDAAGDGDEDIDITWKALWDDENLYVYVEVTDDEIVADDSCDWQDDSIEFYIDAQNLSLEDYQFGNDPDFPDGAPAYQFTMIAGNTFDDGFCGNAFSEQTAFSHGTNSYAGDDLSTRYPQGADVGTTQIIGNVYTSEVAFPWAALEETPENIIARGEFGFGIAVNDDDDGGGRDSQYMWATDLGDLWQRSASFPLVALEGSTAAAGDFDADGDLDDADIDALAAAINTGAGDGKFDVNGDAAVNAADHLSWVKDLKNTWVGDANLDGEFSSADFVAVFTSGKFETGQAAGWAEGDWNGDGVFGSGDFVAAFTDGGFELGPRPDAGGGVSAVPEPSSWTMMLGLLLLATRYGRRRR